MPDKIVIHRTGSRFLRNLACGSECNYLIGNGTLSRDGKVYEYKRPESEINISLQGLFDYLDRKPSEEQWKSLVGLVSKECKKYEIPLHKIYGHRELDRKLGQDTGCPGMTIDFGKLFLDVRLNVDVRDEDIAMNNLRLMKRYGVGTLYSLYPTWYPIRENVIGTEVEFSYDAESGEIYCFGFWQSIPDSLKAASHSGIFEMEMDLKNEKTIIVKTIFRYGSAHSMRNKKSEENLEESVRMFNLEKESESGTGLAE